MRTCVCIYDGSKQNLIAAHHYKDFYADLLNAYFSFKNL